VSVASPSLFETALEIANERRKLFEQLSAAVQANDRDIAWKISRLLCGLPADAPELP